MFFFGGKRSSGSLFLVFAILIFSSSYTFAQKESTPRLSDIDEQLLENADAIVLDQSTVANLIDEKNLIITKAETILVLNENGNDLGVPFLFYNNSMHLNHLTATFYDVFGNELEKVKKNKFSDRSAISGYSLYEDDRVYFYTGRPAQYPFFVKIEYEYETENTLFLPVWRPLRNYALAVQHSNYTILNPSLIRLNIKTQGFEEFNIEVEEEKGHISYTAHKLKAIEQEDFSLPITEYMPLAKVSPSSFYYAGIHGQFDDWESVGKWINTELLEGQDKLPDQVKSEMEILVKDYDSDREKIAAIYDYMQQKCRYISIQIGIGGWKPASASEVHNTSYGDCKALTNYTKALLEAVGILSYYTIVYSGGVARDIDEEYVSIQGNHVILCVPVDDDTLWLECTAQDNPCGYIAGFTDDRDVFVVTPEGGEIMHTKVYEDTLHYEKTTARCTIYEDNSIAIEASIRHSGSFYGKSKSLSSLKTEELLEYYMEKWDLVPQLMITDYSFSDQKDRELFEENVSAVAPDYLQRMGNSIIMRPHILLGNQNYRVNSSLEKNNEFYLSRSYSVIMEYTIILPEAYTVGELPETIDEKYEFGSYFVSIEQDGDHTIRYYRKYTQKKGIYPVEEYSNFIRLLHQVKKNDATNILLNKM